MKSVIAVSIIVASLCMPLNAMMHIRKNVIFSLHANNVCKRVWMHYNHPSCFSKNYCTNSSADDHARLAEELKNVKEELRVFKQEFQQWQREFESDQKAQDISLNVATIGTLIFMLSQVATR
jgi:hypothetical protein